MVWEEYTMVLVIGRELALVAASTLALVGAPALAQTTSPSSSATPAQVGEVIVTAQKRSENLQKVPVSVTVASQAELSQNNIGNTESLDEVIPSLTFKKGTANVNSTLSLRGIGTQSFSSGAEPSVSTVVDGVVFGRAGMAFQEFTDLDHIEVLAGPQGTLFGKNASAGAVNIVTRAPSATLTGDASVAYYGGGEIRADAYVSGPITDHVRASLALVYGDFKGNIYNVYDSRWTNGYRHAGLRGTVVWDITSDLTVTVRGDYVKADDNCCADVLGAYIGGSSPFNNLLLPSIAPVTAYFGSKQVYDDLTPGTRDDNGGLSAQVDYHFDGYTLTSISGWRNWRNKQIRDGDFHAGCCTYANSIVVSDADYGELNYNQFSEELRIASPTDRKLQYVAGAFLWYTTENDWFNRLVNQCFASTLPVNSTGYAPCSTAPGVSTIGYDSGPANWNTKFSDEAAFGQATYAATNKLTLIAGLRFSHDRVQYALNRTRITSAGVPNAPSGIQPTFAYAEHAEDVGISAKGGAQYQLTDDTMLYATYSRGYKGPSLNDFYSEAIGNVGKISPETSNAYEAGAKSQFFDRRLTLNADLFWEDFYNFQANTFVLQGTTTFVTLGDAGHVRSRGFEMQTTWRATRDLTFDGGYTADEANIVAYNCAAAQTAETATPTVANGQSLTKCLLHNGRRLPFAPKNKFNITANYKVPLNNAPFNLGINSTYTYTSLINFDIDQSQLAQQPGYGLWDASAVVSSKDDRYKIAFIAKNLTNQYYTTFITPGGTGAAAGTLNPLLPGSFTRLQIPRDAQRYFGVKLTASF
jgi:iron complex outermembrane receptor protein